MPEPLPPFVLSLDERSRIRGDVHVRSRVLDGETHGGVFPGAVAVALSEVHGSGAGGASGTAG